MTEIGRLSEAVASSLHIVYVVTGLVAVVSLFLGALALAIGTSVLIGSSLIGSSLAHAQVHGAVQYPPASVGEDAQPGVAYRTAVEGLG
jgi:hypothetical protein